MNANPFYEFRAEAGAEPSSAELLIFDAIGSWGEIGEISAKAFARDLAKLPASVKRLDIHINSPGGSVYDAQGIYSRLADHRAEKIVYVDGLAASAASIVAMVGHKVYIRANANMMVHLPSAITIGNEDDHEKSLRALRSIKGAMINTYTKKTGLTRDEIQNFLAAETWFTAEEAVEHGFADEVRGVIKASAIDSKRAIFNGLEFDLSRFHNVPEFTASTETEGNTMPKVKAQTTDEETPPKEKTPKEEEPKEGTPAKEEPKAPPAPQPAEAPKPTPRAPAAEFEQGVKAERERVLALQKLDRPATHALITAAIADGRSVSDIFTDVVDAMDKAAKQAARRVDASVLDGIPASDGADDVTQFGSRLKSAVKKRLKSRGQRSATQSQN